MVRWHTATRAPARREQGLLRLQRIIGNQAVQRMLQTAPTGVPPLVHDVLAAPGQALDPSTHDFMAQRFGRGFGEVRVHADAAAAASARAINALAYTSDRHIVFGAGQYAPHTAAGRTLLAHELTHVVQQTAPGVVRRQPTPDAKRVKAMEARLQALAEDPNQAHEAWKRLAPEERLAVAVRMSKRYGEPFTKSFLWYTEHPIKRSADFSNLPDHTPAWFKARGYALQATSHGSARDTFIEYWVHPSGNQIWQIVKKDPSKNVPADTSKAPDDTSKRVPPPPPPPPNGNCQQLADITKSILDGAIESETSAQANLEGEKTQLESMNKTTDAYCKRFERYMKALQKMKERVESHLRDIKLLRDQLVEMKCDLFSIDLKIDELSDLQNWAEVYSSPAMTQFLKCIKVPDPTDVP